METELSRDDIERLVRVEAQVREINKDLKDQADLATTRHEELKRCINKVGEKVSRHDKDLTRIKAIGSFVSLFLASIGAWLAFLRK